MIKSQYAYMQYAYREYKNKNYIQNIKEEIQGYSFSSYNTLKMFSVLAN